MSPKRMLNPWANKRASPAFRWGAISASYTAACSVSGSRIMITSASATASATDSTRNPASSAFCVDGGAGSQADTDVDAALGQVEGVGMALRPVADHRHLSVPDEARVGILLVVERGHRGQPAFSVSCPMAGAAWSGVLCSPDRSSLGKATRPVRCISTIP